MRKHTITTQFKAYLRQAQLALSVEGVHGPMVLSIILRWYLVYVTVLTLYNYRALSCFIWCYTYDYWSFIPSLNPRTFISIHASTGRGSFTAALDKPFPLPPILSSSIWIQSQSSDLLIDSRAKQQRQKDFGNYCVRMNVGESTSLCDSILICWCRRSYSFSHHPLER